MKPRFASILLVAAAAFFAAGCKGPVQYREQTIGKGPPREWRTFHLSTAKGEFVSLAQPPAPDAEELVHEVVTAAMAERGYRRTPLEEADFLIAVHAHATAMEQIIYYRKPGFRNPKYDLSAPRSQFEDKALGLEFLDPKTRTAVWSCAAYYQEQGSLDRERLAEVTAKIISRFPMRVED